ncbi:HNH endonuclease signature motif containing protein [Glutamicibacter sp.]|uniref:HNH endonuclease n=1 Tax=Glutamicibacter sp. TaxID=1931995 RepID=UPI0028BEFD4F|nr:HNH endonuclease signature motif containing protein [Glutamicibacter sp.]
MSFFQVDDKLHVNEKARALAEAALGGDLTGMAALGLWTMAGSFSRDAKTDGKLTEVHLMKILLNKQAVDLLAALLVRVGLWHASGHGCEKCPEIPAGSYVFHDWFQFGYDTAEDEKLKQAKAKELKDPQLRAQVWARDATDFPICSRGKCRYCGDLVYKKTTKGDKRMEMDHIDPKKANGIQNLVLSCAACNRKKGQRTPQEAGMVLLPAPAREEAPAPLSSTIAPEGPLNVAPEKSSIAPVVEPGQQNLAAGFGLILDTTIEAPAPLSSTIAPEGSQIVAPEQSSVEVPAEGEPSEAYAWMCEEDPEMPAAMTKLATKIGPEAGQERPNSDQTLGAIHGPARAGARAGGVGRGGDGQGARQGQPDPTPDSSKPRRSRSRRKRGRRNNQQPAMTNNNAGAAPQVLTGGKFGSPYKGVHGWQEEAPNSVCEIHGLHLPCRKCEDDAERKYLEGEQ